MWVYTEITYGFNMPQEYEQLKRFEAEVDTSKARRSEDTIAVRYTFVIESSAEYKPKSKPLEAYDGCKELEVDCVWGKVE